MKHEQARPIPSEFGFLRFVLLLGARRAATLVGLALSLAALAGCSSDLVAPTARIALEPGDATSGIGDAGASNADGALVVAVGTRVLLDGSGSLDPNGEPLAYRWRLAVAPPGSHAVIDAPDATVTSVLADVAGVYGVELVVSDGALTSAPASVGFTAGPCGAATPEIGKMHAAPSTPAAGDPVLLSADVTDADLDKACGTSERLSYGWSLAREPIGSRAAFNDATLETPTLFTDEPGTYVVELVVTDALGHTSAPEAITVIASGCPVPVPVVGSVSASPSSPGTFDVVTLSATVNARASGAGGPDAGVPSDGAAPEPGCGDPHFVHHWTLVGVPPGSRVSLVDSPLASPSFVPDTPGDYVAELFLTNDRRARSNTESVTVHVSTCGSKAPVLTAVTSSPASPAIGQSVLLGATVTDADTSAPCSETETFAYAWALTKLPAGSTAKLDDPTLVSPSFFVDVSGTYEATLGVADSHGLVSAPKSVTIVASACGGNAPTVDSVTATPASPDTGAVVALDATATDADTAAPCNLTDTLRFTWTLASVPAGSAAALSGSDQTSPWFLADMPGKYVVAVRAIDAQGHTSPEKTVTVQASACGSAAPVVGSVTATPAAPDTGDTVSLGATVSDADTSPSCGLLESFTFMWSLVSVPAGSRAALSGVHETSPWFRADVPGGYTVEVEVSDASGHTSAPKRATVQASTCGSAAPVVTAIAVVPATPMVGSNVSLSATVSDADTGPGCGKQEAFTYAWVLTRVPSGSAAELTGTDTPLSGFTADVAGTYGVSLVVTDSEGHPSAVATKTVSVAPATACGTSAPVARLASMTAGACPSLTTCQGATITPGVSGAPNPTPPNYVVRLNGHSSVRLDASASFDPDNAAPCSEGDSLSYLWAILAAPVGSAASWSIGSGVTTQMVAPTFVPDLPGTYQVGLVVSDGAHSSKELVVQIVF